MRRGSTNIVRNQTFFQVRMTRLGHRRETWREAEIGQQSHVLKYMLLGWLLGIMALAWLIRFPFALGLVGRLLGRLGILDLLLHVRALVMQFLSAPAFPG